jgi:hypothetical protein
MTFFNKKTDVINIELTPYGRYLLSIGKLKPKYYDFSDDDILYDVSADGSSKESPQDAHNRIVSNTPKLKAVIAKKGVESDAQENYRSTSTMNRSIEDIRTLSQEVSYNQNGISPMGKSSYESNRVPSFQVTALQGRITGSIDYLSSSIVQLPIPQVDVDFVVTVTTASAVLEAHESYEFASHVNDEGKFVYLQFTNPIIHLKEFGSFYEKENFDIEVFEIDNSYTYSYQGQIVAADQRHQSLTPKKFKTYKQAIVNDLLVDIEYPSATAYSEKPATSNFVEYFFSIQIDEDIPQEEVCAAVANVDINSKFLDEELICPDIRTETFDIYSSRVDPSDLEDCD